MCSAFIDYLHFLDYLSMYVGVTMYLLFILVGGQYLGAPLQSPITN